MRLTTLRTPDGPRAARVDGTDAVPLAYPDVAAVLTALSARAPDAGPGTTARSAAIQALPAAADPIPFADADLAPVVVNPSKIFCVGLNYRTHILEMGRQLPDHPTLFAKFADTLLGPRDDVVLPATSTQVDWEAELGVVVGAPLRRATADEARQAIAGYTIVNDVSMRDWQWRTTQWLQGKTFEASTPAGPVLVPPGDVDHARDLAIRCEVDGQTVQDSRTSDLVFDPPAILAYISQFTTLRPGDLIATGTPGGVGAARDPQAFLRLGQTVRTVIEGLGECVNVCRAEVS